MMIPIYFYPSNYYLHILFIWPLMLAGWPGAKREKEWSVLAATVLLACAIMWFGWLIPGNYGQFLFSSGVLLVTIVLLLAIPIRGERRGATSGTA
jgi:peptidoglycan/LPS O-acetylase OafA/YrhL